MMLLVWWRRQQRQHQVRLHLSRRLHMRVCDLKLLQDLTI